MNTQAVAAPAAILPLSLTYLCMNCEALSLGRVCPACGSRHRVPVAKFLDRPAAAAGR